MESRRKTGDESHEDAQERKGREREDESERVHDRRAGLRPLKLIDARSLR